MDSVGEVGSIFLGVEYFLSRGGKVWNGFCGWGGSVEQYGDGLQHGRIL